MALDKSEHEPHLHVAPGELVRAHEDMTYEYLCQACGHQWEAQQSISDDPLKDCPKCGEPQAKRQISRGGGFILKGGGWYNDLYSSSGSTSASSTETSSDTDSSSGSDSSD